MITDPLFYAVAIPAVLIFGLSKGGFAGGLGFLAVPLISLVISPVQAAGILLPILCVMDLIGVYAYRRDFDFKNIVIFIPGALMGIAAGWATAHLLNEAVILLLVGAIAVIFTLDHWIGRREAADPKPRSWPKGSFWGAVSGFTSFVAHAGAPPYQVYMLPQKLPKRVYVGTAVYCYWIINLAKLPPYWALGQLSLGNLETSLILMPLAPIGMLLGIKLLHIIPEKPFYRIAYILVFLVGCRLLWSGAREFGLF